MKKDIMTTEEIRQMKAELGITAEDLARDSGVPYSTVTKILCGSIKNPGLAKLKALEMSLKRFLKDETGSMPAPRRYTLDDYYALPDDQRMELIDGIFYNMSAPTVWHQRIAGSIYFELLSYVRKKGGKCLPLISPIDVQLDKDDSTMLQPDVAIICDPQKVKRNKIYGAPDWVLEVSSKSTKKRDYFLKLNKYRNAYVKEYWIIDHDKITVYSNLNTDNFQLNIYSFQDKIPVGIYDDLVIDMAELIDFEDEPEDSPAE